LAARQYCGVESPTAPIKSEQISEAAQLSIDAKKPSKSLFSKAFHRMQL
jgi:hypothetical protein